MGRSVTRSPCGRCGHRVCRGVTRRYGGCLVVRGVRRSRRQDGKVGGISRESETLDLNDVRDKISVGVQLLDVHQCQLTGTRILVVGTVDVQCSIRRNGRNVADCTGVQTSDDDVRVDALEPDQI